MHIYIRGSGLWALVFLLRDGITFFMYLYKKCFYLGRFIFLVLINVLVLVMIVSACNVIYISAFHIAKFMMFWWGLNVQNVLSVFSPFGMTVDQC